MHVHGRYIVYTWHMFVFGIWQASGMYLVYTGNMIPYCHRCGYCRCRPAPVVVAASLTKTLRTRGPGQGPSQLAQPCSSSRNCAFFQPAGCSCCQPVPSRQLLDAEAKETFLESEKIASFLQPCPRPSPHQQCRRPPASAASACGGCPVPHEPTSDIQVLPMADNPPATADVSQGSTAGGVPPVSPAAAQAGRHVELSSRGDTDAGGRGAACAGAGAGAGGRESCRWAAGDGGRDPPQLPRSVCMASSAARGENPCPPPRGRNGLIRPEAACAPPSPPAAPPSGAPGGDGGGAAGGHGGTTMTTGWGGGTAGGPKLGHRGGRRAAACWESSKLCDVASPGPVVGAAGPTGSPPAAAAGGGWAGAAGAAAGERAGGGGHRPVPGLADQAATAAATAVGGGVQRRAVAPGITCSGEAGLGEPGRALAGLAAVVAG